MFKKPLALSKRVRQNARNEAGEIEVKKEGWSADELGEQSTYEGTTEISRRLRRGDESVGDPDERDVAGDIPQKDMPHGREVRRRPRRSSRETRTRNATEELL